VFFVQNELNCRMSAECVTGVWEQMIPQKAVLIQCRVPVKVISVLYSFFSFLVIMTEPYASHDASEIELCRQ